MIVTVKLFASFQKGRFATEPRDYADGVTIQDIVDDLHLPVPEIGVILVNSRHVDFEFRPSTGDTIAIFPVIGGG